MASIIDAPRLRKINARRAQIRPRFAARRRGVFISIADEFAIYSLYAHDFIRISESLVMSATTLLLTDLYQLNMIKTYLDHDQVKTAVFEFFVRKLPTRRGFLLAAGLEQALDFLESFQYSAEELDWLDRTRRFDRALLAHLESFRFTGEVHAMPEGTVFFANEPILRVTAPLPQAQLAETRLINILHFQSLIASKAARIVLTAPGKVLVDFGLRRAHGAEAGLLAARASYLAGFAGTATVLAGRDFGIPVVGTMAHSFVQAHDDEATAFDRFARVRPKALTLLIDTDRKSV